MRCATLPLCLALVLAGSSAAAQEALPAPATPAAPPAAASPPASAVPAPVLPAGQAPVPLPQAVEAPKPAGEAPGSGLLWILGGTSLGVAGVVNLATSPLCLSSSIRSTAQTPCLATSIAFGVGLLAAGIPLLVVGAHRRAEWSEWTKRVTVEPAKSGAAGSVAWTF